MTSRKSSSVYSEFVSASVKVLLRSAYFYKSLMLLRDMLGQDVGLDYVRSDLVVQCKTKLHVRKAYRRHGGKNSSSYLLIGTLDEVCF